MSNNIQAYIPNFCPSWESVTHIFDDCSLMTVVDRLARGWQVTLTLGGAVLSVAQAVALLVSGMLGWAICAVAVAGVLVFAASYVAQHSLIEELQENLDTARQNNAALQAEITHVQSVAQNLERGIQGLDAHDKRLEQGVAQLEIVQGGAAARLERIAAGYQQLLSDPEMQKKIQAAQKTLADLDKRAVATQAKNEELLKQYAARNQELAQVNRDVISSTQKLTGAVGQAAPLIVQSAKKFDQAANRLEDASHSVLATHTPVSPAALGMSEAS